MNIIEEARQKAVDVLEKCAKETGFYASGFEGSYQTLWSRDSMITSLGACFIDQKFKETFENSLQLLAKNQSELGQIPNCVGDYNIDRKSDVTFNTIDSTLWFLIGNFVFAKIYNDKTLLKKFQKNINQAFLWLKYQDPNEDGMLSQQPTMDWQDAFCHKYGRTINSHALYYAALKMFGKNELAQRVKKVINGETEKYLSLYDEKLGYYIPWAWKNHDGENEREEWFDALGNLLAIAGGLATSEISENILKYIEEKKVDRPYPCKAIFPPIKEGDKEWKPYFAQCLAKDPYQYLNAGVWPFIGGFYVAALVKQKKYEKAEQELENLAQANKLGEEGEWEFNEWLDGQTGQAKGSPCQGWSAGSFLFASECLEKREVLFFT